MNNNEVAQYLGSCSQADLESVIKSLDTTKSNRLAVSYNKIVEDDKKAVAESKLHYTIKVIEHEDIMDYIDELHGLKYTIQDYCSDDMDITKNQLLFFANAIGRMADSIEREIKTIEKYTPSK